MSERPSSAAASIRQVTSGQIVRNVEMLTHLVEQNEPVIAVAEAQRRHVGDVRDALKWAAAFSTAALLSTAQLFRSGREGGLLPLADGVGLAIGSLAFLVSIVGAGLFLVTVDLAMAEWLRLVVTHVHVDLQDYRSAMMAYSDANAALAAENDADASMALDRAGELGDEVRARGAFPVPATSLAALERLWLWVCLGGFAVGILAVLGDFVMKVPLSAR